MDIKLMLMTMGVSFILAVILGPLTIPLLRRLKFGQQVRDDGPQGHLKKAGTPTMGGAIILLAFTLAFLKFSVTDIDFYVLLIATLGFGLIGFLDDYIKIVFKRSLGLTARQKLIGQLACSAVICVLLWQSDHSTVLAVPGTSWGLDLGWFYYPFIILMMLAISNAVNFTDGLDGLLSGTSAIALAAFALIAMQLSEIAAAVCAAAMIGAVLGFLVFNAHPAKVFMGDTGSLGIGGAIGAIAILTKTELLFLVIGGIFVIEMLSVVIQVVSFKTRGKRVFKMSPIHHHFELSGWSEWRVVITFWLAGIVLAGLGLWINKGL
ncbi:phospho-N-acetylmuramoyl-pentapeptide-transferase [Paenibacillus melissococcoides]|uniref:Phospho-N-acetylmuramoyl-pentapeptide-transferase n=1 Tax=Paenibacillus melissococcoides TaxID=2912268 RepID=A0ABM9G1Y9_9BACL|nr:MULTISPECIES: phospho-N-acetylmuramoyl-pentapeptide-transferase [Paenibacillus]MEB9897977.1 phospho-N-acetylmuramoyl-pentapeptide-transferase [Bacillus cereus]CAH8245235.1 phospho-N-acetylmuramoyl-pentapeptide-transferase [Paenibacillus melissococcoides]CAH8710370.1 phospho-N-acetylmuramoyl-pentapeptide-transferase [Paenibacillus melissococcoides]CAH8711139.1 phospho-N-acetylmuramoyl-pentapeptide-transferase [Paenibacillus melissococcoides]GIO78885.1 phospho-N-acetylmuramoyl-pentapeptide-tr